MGRVGEEKFQIMCASDIYVSTAIHEGFGLVFLEAMESGLPVISYNNGGQVDFLMDNTTGFLVEFGASYRLIIDFSDFDNSLGVLPGGQRSNPYCNHYLDQLGLWVVGEYHPLPYPATLAEMNQYESIFVLRPE